MTKPTEIRLVADARLVHNKNWYAYRIERKTWSGWRLVESYKSLETARKTFSLMTAGKQLGVFTVLAEGVTDDVAEYVQP